MCENAPTMGRELVWLENTAFAAWGCSACGWIVSGANTTGKPSPEVKKAFIEHDCNRFPRYTKTAHPLPRLRRSKPGRSNVSTERWFKFERGQY